MKNVKCIENTIVVFDHICIDGTPKGHFCTTRIQTHDHKDHMKNFFGSYARLKHTILTEPTFEILKKISYKKQSQGLDIRPNIRKLKYKERFIFDEDGESYGITLFQNAHILGSSMSLVEKIASGETILYSSDLGPQIFEKDLHIPKADTVIIDATVGSVDPDNQKEWNTSIERLIEKLVEISDQDRPFQFAGVRGTIEKVMQSLASAFPDIPILISSKLKNTLDVYQKEGYQITNPVECISNIDISDIPKYFYFCVDDEEFSDVHYGDPIYFTLSGFELLKSKEYVKELADNHFNCFVTAHASYQTYIDFILKTEAKSIIVDNTRTNAGVERVVNSLKSEKILESVSINSLKELTNG